MKTLKTIKPMKQDHLPVTVAVVVIVALAAVLSLWDFQFGQARNSVCIRERCFRVEIAATSDDRARGLMHRESLAEDRGMLFIYPEEGIYQFWMKNTLIPLDMIWISSDRKIVNIKKGAQPCPSGVSCPTMNPGADSRYVLEINGGLSEQYGFGVGDDVEFNI